MKRLLHLLLPVCLFGSTARATVSVEFQLGAVDLPAGSLGVLVADTEGNGFTPVASAVGTVLAPGESLTASDDKIVAVFSVGELTDWGSARGFAVVLPPLDYAALGVAAGQSLIFYAFPGRTAGQTIRQDEASIAYRSDNAAELAGDMGFALPPDGGAYQLAALAGNQGGGADLTGFGPAEPNLRVAIEGGAVLGNGANLDFGDLPLGDSATRTLRVSNSGSAALTGLSLDASGAGLGHYQIDPLGSDPLGPGDSFLMAVEFAPTSSGNHPATLALASNDPGSFALNLIGRSDHRHGKPFVAPGSGAADPDATDNENWGWATDWDATVAPIYDGLLRDQTDGETLLGAISRLVVTAPREDSGLGGSFSTVVRLNGRSAAVRGAFNNDGQFTQNFPQRDGTNVAVDLQLMEITNGSDNETIRGTVTWDGTTAVVDLPRAPYSRANPLTGDSLGAHTMILPSQIGSGTNEPAGDGWATVNVTTTGVVTTKGVLGDGTRFSETAYLSAEGEASLYTEPYPSKPVAGRFGGKVTFRNQIDISDFDGVMQWRKFPDPKSARYKDGFDIEVWALGSRYSPPVAGQRVLAQLADQHHNAELSLIGPTAPGVGGGLDRVLSWLGNNRLVHYGPVALGGTAIAKDGTLSGSFYDPATRLRINFTGVAFEKQGLAAGVFVNGAASGAVRILPGTGFDYPGSEAAGNLTRIGTLAVPANDPVETVSNFSADVAGIYGGRLESSIGNAVSGALEGVTVTAAGAISGVLWIEGVRHPFRGSFPTDGSGLGTGPAIIDLPGPGIRLTLQPTTFGAGGFGIEGGISLDGGATIAHTIDAQRRPAFTRANPSLQAGAHTIALRPHDGVDPLVAPGGDGYGTLSVSYLGTCTGLVTLPEGTKASLGGHLGATYDDAGTPTTEWSFHRGLYGRIPRGFLAGKLYFRETVGIGDLDGQWRWVKQPGAAPATVYPGGIDTTRDVVGGRYTPPAPGVRAMEGLANDWFNLWLRFAGPDLSTMPTLNLTELDRAATWTAANKIVYHGPETVKVTYNIKTGLLTGSYLDAANGMNVKFGGVLLQDQNLVTGSYTVPGGGGTVSGLFSAEKR